MRILIADDHAVVREGVKRILTAVDEGVVVGEASNGEKLLAKSTAEMWDVVLLDISMPGRNGLDVLRQLKSTYPLLQCWFSACILNINMPCAPLSLGRRAISPRKAFLKNWSPLSVR
jgi:DNA-binding NarL/FixJ family response regulator